MIHGKTKFTTLSKLAGPQNPLLKIILIAQLALRFQCRRASTRG